MDEQLIECIKRLYRETRSYVWVRNEKFEVAKIAKIRMVRKIVLKDEIRREVCDGNWLPIPRRMGKSGGVYIKICVLTSGIYS